MEQTKQALKRCNPKKNWKGCRPKCYHSMTSLVSVDTKLTGMAFYQGCDCSTTAKCT